MQIGLNETNFGDKIKKKKKRARIMEERTLRQMSNKNNVNVNLLVLLL